MYYLRNQCTPLCGRDHSAYRSYNDPLVRIQLTGICVTSFRDQVARNKSGQAMKLTALHNKFTRRQIRQIIIFLIFMISQFYKFSHLFDDIQHHYSQYLQYQIQSKMKSPSDFLKQALGREVLVKLNMGSDVKGILICLDGTMNIVLQKASQHVLGQTLYYSRVLIRGNNVSFMSLKFYDKPK